MGPRQSHRRAGAVDKHCYPFFGKGPGCITTSKVFAVSLMVCDVCVQLDLVLAQMREAMRNVGADTTILRHSSPSNATKQTAGAVLVTIAIFSKVHCLMLQGWTSWIFGVLRRLCAPAGGASADVLVRKYATGMPSMEIRVAVIGNVDSGKSTLVNSSLRL